MDFPPQPQPASTPGCGWRAWRWIALALLASAVALAGCSGDNGESPTATRAPDADPSAPAPVEAPSAQNAATPTMSADPEPASMGETVPAGAYTEIGVPIYPGARLLEEHTYRVTVQHQESAVNMLEILLVTRDAIEGVSEFYRGALPTRSTQIFALDGADGRTVSITTELPDQSSTNILVTEHSDDGSTHIKITHMGAGDLSLGQP
jgi:hypothetical protein